MSPLVSWNFAHRWFLRDVEANIISGLSHGEHIETVVRVEEVKPKEQTSPTILDDYHALLTRFDHCVRSVDNRHSSICHAHPWFGSLTAHQWLFLAAAHQRQHLKQIRSILKNGDNRKN